LRLLVDGCRQVVDQCRTGLVLFVRELQHARVCLLGLRELARLEAGMGDHRPGSASDRRVGRRIGVDQLEAGSDRWLEVPHAVQVVDRRAEHGRRVLVVRERFDEPERAGYGGPFHRLLIRLGRAALVLAMSVDRGVSGFRRPSVVGVGVGSAFVLSSRRSEVLVLEKQVREAMMDAG
jgi:hypothetical protein